MPARPARRSDRSTSRPPTPPKSEGRTEFRTEAPRAFDHGADEQSLRDHAVLAATLDPIITIDAAGVIQSSSESVLRVLGWTPDELVGRNVNILMPEPHHSAHDDYLVRYHRTGQTMILNRPRRFDALRKDGSLVPIELCVTRAEIPGGAPLFVGIIRDMSEFVAAERSRDEERVRAQHQLADQTSALQQANLRLRMADRMASIGTLASGLGHDMNNVLLPVRARLDALLASIGDDPLSRTDRIHVEEIRKCIAYLQQLADGLHFLALDPDVEEDQRGGGATTDLGQWWSQVGVLLSKAVPRHVRVRASIPASLPQVAVAAHGLTQAVLNLVVNAGEAIPPPSERKRKQGIVRIRAEEFEEDDRGWIRFSVTDNGTGMAEDVRRRAFDLFFTTKPRGLGTGLGLALVHRVVEHAGGRVEIESVIGKGTEVVMILPAVRREAGGEESGAIRAEVTVADGRAAGLIRHLLESAGAAPQQGNADSAHLWVVDPSTTSAAVVKAWRRRRPDGRIVLFGQPGAKAIESWRSLDPVTIVDTNDLDAIRRAVMLALSNLEGVHCA